MITKSNAYFIENNEEVLPMDEPLFPHICLSALLREYPGGIISWHWHSAFEINHIVNGPVKISTTEQEILLPTGAAIFINSNVIHALSGTEADTHAHLFSSTLLSGTAGNIIDTRYVSPIQGNTGLPFFCLFPENPEDKSMLDLVKRADDLCIKEPVGWEMKLRDVLSEFWIFLFQRNKHILKKPLRQKFTDDDRLRAILHCIQNGYAQKLTLGMIADSAGISERECTRCFQRTIGASPIQYLNQFRLEKAAQKLLHSSENIIEISESCGFSSGSYFTKCFRNRYRCSPKEFRKQKRGTPL